MKTLNVALGIWLRTITLFAFMVGICSLFQAGGLAVLVVILVFIGALICTSPVLILLCLLIDMQMSLPYTWRARFAWFTFMLMVIVAGVFLLAAILVHADASSDFQILYYGASCAGLSVLGALFFSTNALRRLDQHGQEVKQFSNKYNFISHE
jgi:hypothetical protein